MDAARRHAEAIATLRAFAAASGATRVSLLLDAGEGRAVLFEGDAGGTVTVTEGEASEVVPAGAPLSAPPLPLPHVHAVPATAITVDPGVGELAAPLGVVQLLAGGLLALAGAFGGHSAATAEFATRDPALPITLAARAGEPALVEAGGRTFELP